MTSGRSEICTHVGFPRGVARGLLHDKPYDAGTEPRPKHMRPETGSVAVTVNCRGDAGLLAGWSTEGDVCPVSPKRSNVVMDGDPGVPARNLLTAPWVDLAEGRGLEPPDAVDPVLVEAETGEEVEDLHDAPPMAGVRRGAVKTSEISWKDAANPLMNNGRAFVAVGWKRSLLQRFSRDSDSVNLGSNPGPPASSNH